MPRVIRRTPLENYVKDYLKSTATRRLANTNLLLRAAEYIKIKIASDCCDPDNPIIDLHTGKESVFTKTVYTMLYGMTRNGNIQSLQRTYDAIINYVTPPCCFENSTTFSLAGTSGDVHTEGNDPSNLTVAATTEGPFIGSITHLDLYINGVLDSVYIGNNASAIIHVTTPVGTTVYTYYWKAYTDSGTNVQSIPTTATYINP